MRREYDFSKAVSNPYVKRLRKPVSIRVDTDTIEYFQKQADVVGIPYQSLINLYLSDCVFHEKKIDVAWR